MQDWSVPHILCLLLAWPLLRTFGKSNKMLRSTTILGKIRKISTSMTLVVIFGFHIIPLPLVWIRPLSLVVFAFTRFVLWKRSIEVIPSIFLYIVNLRQRRRTNKALMMILQKKFIMFFYLSQCMNKLGIKLAIMSPVLLLQYSIRRKHGRECFLYLVCIRWLFLTKLQLRANPMNNVIIVYQRFEILEM